jgi:hypothetical protein
MRSSYWIACFRKNVHIPKTACWRPCNAKSVRQGFTGVKILKVGEGKSSKWDLLIGSPAFVRTCISRRRLVGGKVGEGKDLQHTFEIPCWQGLLYSKYVRACGPPVYSALRSGACYAFMVWSVRRCKSYSSLKLSSRTI